MSAERRPSHKLGGAVRRFVKVTAVALAVAGLFSGCGAQGGGKTSSGGATSTTAGSTSKPGTPKPSTAPVPEPKSDGRMVLLDRLSIPKMEGWEYLSEEEGKADTDRGNDAFIDTKGCTGEALKIHQCPRVIVADEAAALKYAKENGFGDLLKGMNRDQIAQLTLCKTSSKKGASRKPEGTDDIDGVTAYRYHATLKDCGIDPKSIPIIDPAFKGGSTLWIIKTNKVFISIYATDSGAKGMVKYTDINKLRYALNHGKWIS